MFLKYSCFQIRSQKGSGTFSWPVVLWLLWWNCWLSSISSLKYYNSLNLTENKVHDAYCWTIAKINKNKNLYIKVDVWVLFWVISGVLFKDCAQSLSHVRLFTTPWNVAHQAPLSMGFPGKNNTRMGCHFFLQRIFLTQGLNLCLLLWQEDFFFTTEPPRNPQILK